MSPSHTICGVHAGVVHIVTGIPVKWSSTGLSLNQGGPPGHSSTPIPADVIHHAALISDLCTKARSTCSRLFSDEVRKSCIACLSLCYRA